MNSEQLPEIRRRNSAKNGSSRDQNSGTNQILPAAAAPSSLDSQSPQTSEGNKNKEFYRLKFSCWLSHFGGAFRFVGSMYKLEVPLVQIKVHTLQVFPL